MGFSDGILVVIVVSFLMPFAMWLVTAIAYAIGRAFRGGKDGY